MSDVTKIHTVDVYVVTVKGNFIRRLNEQRNVADLQSFDYKTMVNLKNVSYMEVVNDGEE